ncbi:RagB/SusD family nutrient uptake outer membrane protein [Sinomicrobium weinanense]|uniref:RagB/SusD family nutrient uptake outer membrane protein n=1 Tax=Sinomicrobium weinanense TaxID=2842200 RepID=A0A926Q218_9FLAO|nr:RagB/SusD family nutrient uptake outer membrane protein [Sinomicrobium weinanense]MBC9794456.1 RagB/SusD family nutrient uptake outer membrane protein [Sinomicrobium weinanense]MBU3124363.1 RagB/SusD family nutrient uptake outer membrane protein [Sinomicrobium weinanense]
MKKIIATFLIITLFFTVGSCSYDDLDKTNPNQLVVDTYYQNESELNSGLYAIYGTMAGANLFSRSYWFFNDIRSDEVSSGGGQLTAEFNQILNGTHDASNPVNASIWKGLYQVIHRANIVINKAPEAMEVDESIREKIIAEARCARGWAYYELGTIWGKAPVYLTYVTNFSETNPVSSQQEVLDQAVEDLTAAAAVLDFSGSKKGRMSKGSALALLGRVYMFTGDYTKAKEALDEIVTSGNYALVDEYDDNFQEENEYNSESIWEIGFAKIGAYNWADTGDGTGNEASIHSQEYSAYGWRNIIPSQKMLDEFERPENGAEKRDPRLDKNLYFVGDTFNNGTEVIESGNIKGSALKYNGGEMKISWRKHSAMYKVNPAGYYESGINHRVIRYAEVLLNLAECELEAGDQNKSVEYLNMIRQRTSVNMPPYPTSKYPTGTKDEVFAAIMHEKMVELADEQVRNRDLLRWRAQGKLKEEPLEYYSPRHQFMPIPQQEIDNNANITENDQNSGY